MQKIILPVRMIYISQGMYGTYSHKGKMAIDFASSNKEYRKCYAPYDGIIKYKSNKANGNIIWLESKDKVLSATGDIDYFCLMLVHCDNIDHLTVGQEIKQGEYFYTMGTAGNASGVHTHLELAKGKYGKSVRIDPTINMYITKDTKVTTQQYQWKVDDNMEYETYTVVKGDNLTKIANKFNTTVNELVRLNNITNPNRIEIGQVLKIREIKEICENCEKLKLEIEELKKELASFTKIEAYIKK